VFSQSPSRKNKSAVRSRLFDPTGRFGNRSQRLAHVETFHNKLEDLHKMQKDAQPSMEQFIATLIAAPVP
jgi:hypothetical protein